jgi:hypothetical protein
MANTNRASYLLAQGKPTAQIAVYFPTTSLWLGHNESEKSTFDFAQQLLESQHDFDFIDEYSLTTFQLGKGVITNKSGQEYRTIIVPSVIVLSKAASNRLQEFAKGGGQVIFSGEKPSMLVDKSFLNAESKSDFQFAVQKTTTASLGALPGDVVLDKPFALLKYLHRQWKDADLFFFFNESSEAVSRNITVAVKGKVEEWDANTGAIKPMKTSGNEATQLTLSLLPYETKFIVIYR